MKSLIIIGLYLLLNGCGTYHIKIEEKPKPNGIPITDSGGNTHIYRSSRSLELNNDYALYCMSHHRWETISVRYSPTLLTKLRKEEFIVRSHPKNS